MLRREKVVFIFWFIIGSLELITILYCVYCMMLLVFFLCYKWDFINISFYNVIVFEGDF